MSVLLKASLKQRSFVNTILNTPIEIRLALLAVIGAWVGGQLNRAIYRFAFSPRSISPWSTPPEKAPPRKWIDRLPIIGWFYLRREASIHGAGFWVRPLLIEIGCAIAFAWLYDWEIRGNLLPALRGATAAAGPEMLHAQFLSHLVLMCLMIVATFIDFDEKTIPDWVTVPGTLFALTLVTALPIANLPVVKVIAPGQAEIVPMQATSPLPWRANFDGQTGLEIGLACYLVWTTALLHYTFTTRRGWKKAFVYLFASLVRDRMQIIRYLVLSVVGAMLIIWVWSTGGPQWQALLSALIGLAGGGGLVWMVRIIASHAMRVEAMGFGDVTLMAMIGAFLGWQAAIMIFFMAPALGSIIAVVQKVVTGESEIAFGPYLCAAAAVMVVCWNPIWNGWAVDIFSLGWFIPLVVFACVGLMGVMLFVWRLIKEMIFA